MVEPHSISTRGLARLQRNPAHQAAVDRGTTIRALIFGLCLSLVISVLGNVVRYILHSSFMAYSHMPMGNLIVWLLSILFCAALAKGFGRTFVFSSSEWITVFAMGFIASLGPTYGGKRLPGGCHRDTLLFRHTREPVGRVSASVPP